jgi:hypothetical protein
MEGRLPRAGATLQKTAILVYTGHDVLRARGSVDV